MEIGIHPVGIHPESGTSSARRLKQQLHRELDLPRIFRRCVLPEHRCESRPSGDVREVGVVEHIERFDTELKSRALFYGGVFTQRYVEFFSGAANTTLRPELPKGNGDGI
jgi:hypothetical protein